MREIIASSMDTSMNNNEVAEELSSVLQGLGGASPKKDTLLLDSIIDLFFSGTQTLLSASFSLVHQLSKREDVLEKLRQEIDSQDLSSAQEGINANDLNKLPFVDAVVKETLRFMPPVGGAYRTVIEPFELEVSDLNNLTLKYFRHTYILVSFYYNRTYH